MTGYVHAGCYSEDEIHELRTEIDTLNRVTARLLDGWEPETQAVQQFRSPVPNRRRGDPLYQTEPMSDGEAAIIRNHQERTT